MTATFEPSSPADDGASRNLFVEADPEYDALTLPPTGSSSAIASGTARRLGGRRGLVMPVDGSSRGRSGGRADAARFTRRKSTFGRLRGFVGRRLRQADLAGGRLLGPLASRRYGALAAAATVGAVPVTLTWLTLGLREASTGRVTAEQRLARATVAVRTDRNRIDAVSTKLRQATRATGESLAITPTSGTRGPATKGRPNRLPRPHRRH
jgi:hypothetical protein